MKHQIESSNLAKIARILQEKGINARYVSGLAKSEFIAPKISVSKLALHNAANEEFIHSFLSDLKSSTPKASKSYSVVSAKMSSGVKKAAIPNKSSGHNVAHAKKKAH